MSYSKSTRHYNLPQFQPLDSPTWYGDVNEAMHTIDETMYQNSFNSGGKALADEVTAIRSMIGENSDYLIDGSIHLNQNKMVLPGTVDYLNGKTNNIKTIIGNPNQLPANPDGTVPPITNIINTMSGNIETLTDLVADDSEAVEMVNNELSNVKKSVTKNTQDIAGIQGNIGNIEATADSANHNATTARTNADEAISRVEVVENDLQGTNNALSSTTSLIGNKTNLPYQNESVINNVNNNYQNLQGVLTQLSEKLNISYSRINTYGTSNLCTVVQSNLIMYTFDNTSDYFSLIKGVVILKILKGSGTRYFTISPLYKNTYPFYYFGGYLLNTTTYNIAGYAYIDSANPTMVKIDIYDRESDYNTNLILGF